jgi:hypothetical protein
MRWSSATVQHIDRRLMGAYSGVRAWLSAAPVMESPVGHPLSFQSVQASFQGNAITTDLSTGREDQMSREVVGAVNQVWRR